MVQAKWVRLKSPALALFAFAAASVAQQATSPQQTAPDSGGATIKVTSRLTLVDVTATDSKGKPVQGLVESDFAVKEDGKPQPIKNFEEYGTERPAAQAVTPPLPPNVYTNAQPPAPTTGAANVFMFDDVTTGLAEGLTAHPEYMMYARQQALKYLKTMPAGTRVAVLELTDRLRVVQDFTSDQAVLLAAISSITLKPVQEAYFIPPPRYDVPHGKHPVPVLPAEVCSPMNTQSELTVNALDAAAAFLAGVPGRKNLIWFTPGIPWLTSYPDFSRVPCLRDDTAELQRAYGLLTTARVALYPVDPRGLCVYCSPFQDIHSMQEMAKATGGVAYYNRNDLDAAVAEAIATGTDYYSLSYVPPLSKYDGQFHKIDVKVDRLGIHLQYRDGYTAIDLAKPPKEAKASADKTAAQYEDESHTFFMTHGAALSTQMLFAVRVTPSTAPAKPDDPPVIGKPDPALRGKPLVRYDFQYALYPDQITLSSDANGKRMASIEFVMAAYDGAGKMLNVRTEKVSFAVNADRLALFLQKPFQFPLQFDLPPGNIFVRIGVRDVPSGSVGTLEIPVTVDKPKK